MKDFIEAVGKYLRNVKPFSGQAFILLSVFSWLMSLLVKSEYVRDWLAWLGWFFLTIGTGWLLAKVKQNIFGIDVYPGPWISGAMACGLIFYWWTSDLSLAVVSWPIVSALIAIIPKFLKASKWIDLVNPIYPDPKKFATDRREMVMLLLFSAILSCWLQFHFVVQDWLERYPSLEADSFARSPFVVKVGVDEIPPTSRGVTILNLAETAIRNKLEPAAWSEVERWLLNIKNEINSLESQIMSTIPATPEDPLWDLQAQVVPGNPDYRVQLQAVWKGPSSRPGGFYAEKICQVTQRPSLISPSPGSASGASNPAATNSSQVVCEPAVDHIWLDQVTN